MKEREFGAQRCKTAERREGSDQGVRERKERGKGEERRRTHAASSIHFNGEDYAGRCCRLLVLFLPFFPSLFFSICNGCFLLSQRKGSLFPLLPLTLPLTKKETADDACGGPASRFLNQEGSNRAKTSPSSPKTEKPSPFCVKVQSLLLLPPSFTPFTL